MKAAMYLLQNPKQAALAWHEDVGLCRRPLSRHTEQLMQRLPDQKHLTIQPQPGVGSNLQAPPRYSKPQDQKVRPVNEQELRAGSRKLGWCRAALLRQMNAHPLGAAPASPAVSSFWFASPGRCGSALCAACHRQCQPAQSGASR